MNRRSHDPDEIDAFFEIDGDLNQYLIPSQVVGGLSAIRLSADGQYQLDARPR